MAGSPARTGTVLIAPPRFLGVLNGALGGEIGDLVTLRIRKNLTRKKREAIRAELPRSWS